MAEKTPTYLKHKKTGEVYPYSSFLAKRPDFEPTEQAPPVANAIHKPPAGGAVAPSQTGDVGKLVEGILLSTLAPFQARIDVLEKQVAALIGRDVASAVSVAQVAQAAPAAVVDMARPRRRKLHEMSADDAVAKETAAIDQLMANAEAAAAKDE